jgi:hypothetical protein
MKTAFLVLTLAISSTIASSASAAPLLVEECQRFAKQQRDTWRAQEKNWGLTWETAQGLCTGTTHASWPIHCFGMLRAEEQKREIFEASPILVKVCARAASSAPARCYLQAREQMDHSVQLVTDLCAQAPELNFNGPIDCFIESNRRNMGDLNVSLQLCKQASTNAIVDCYLKRRSDPTVNSARAIADCRAEFIR